MTLSITIIIKQIGRKVYCPSFMLVKIKPTMLSDVMLVERHHSECHNSECHNPECRQAECRGAVCFTQPLENVTNLKFSKETVWRAFNLSTKLIIICHHTYDSETREALLKGKDQYRWPPYTNKFRSVAFYIRNIIYLIQNKVSYRGGQLYWALPFS